MNLRLSMNHSRQRRMNTFRRCSIYRSRMKSIDCRVCDRSNNLCRWDRSNVLPSSESERNEAIEAQKHTRTVPSATTHESQVAAFEQDAHVGLQGAEKQLGKCRFSHT